MSILFCSLARIVSIRKFHVDFCNALVCALNYHHGYLLLGSAFFESHFGDYPCDFSHDRLRTVRLDLLGQKSAVGFFNVISMANG